MYFTRSCFYHSDYNDLIYRLFITVALPPIPNLLEQCFASPINYPTLAALRGKIPSRTVDDIGQYFPFLNRRAQLLELLREIHGLIYADKTSTDSSKRVRFTICHGIAGLGKTTFATHGVLHMLDKLPTKKWKSKVGSFAQLNELIIPIQFERVGGLVLELAERQCVYRISFLDIPFVPSETRAAFCIAMRLLYTFLHPTHRFSRQYTDWLDSYAFPLCV